MNNKMEKNNLIQVTPNCFIVRTQSGFNKLLKRLHCKGKDNYDYSYSIRQITNDKNAIESTKQYQKYDEKGNALYNEDGTPKVYTSFKYKQYPVKYPFILTFEDMTFEFSAYNFYIRYVFDDLRIKDIIDENELYKLESK